jgi:hypothetical protein
MNKSLMSFPPVTLEIKDGDICEEARFMTLPLSFNVKEVKWDDTTMIPDKDWVPVNHTPMSYHLVGDIEATGPCWRRDAMTCMAFVLMAPNGQITKSYKSYLALPPGAGWDERTVNEFWLKYPDVYEMTQKEVAKARQPKEVMTEFLAWVREVTKDKDVRLVFDTAGFDAGWINYHLTSLDEKVGIDWMMGHYEPPTCLGSYMLGAGQATFDKSSKKSFCKAKGLTMPKWPVSHDHDPLNDATVIAYNLHWVLMNNTAVEEQLV